MGAIACSSSSELELQVGPLDLTQDKQTIEMCFVESCSESIDAADPEACIILPIGSGLRMPRDIPANAGAVQVRLRSADCSSTVAGCAPLPEKGGALSVEVASVGGACGAGQLCCRGECKAPESLCADNPDGGDPPLDMGLDGTEPRDFGQDAPTDADPGDADASVPWTVAHLQAKDSKPGSAPLVLAGEVIDTSALTVGDEALPAGITFESVPQSDPTASAVAVLRVDSLEVQGTVRVQGSRPLVVVAASTIRIAGILDVAAQLSSAGPGGFAPSAGRGAGGNSAGRAGGGGAGHAQAGAEGGAASVGTPGRGGMATATSGSLTGERVEVPRLPRYRASTVGKAEAAEEASSSARRMTSSSWVAA